MSRHYLDHASTAPLRPQARDALLPWLDAAAAGDPGRIHAEGLAARHAVEAAREQVAAFLGARPRSVVFTSGATEAIAAACFGAARRRPDGVQIVAAVEHSAVRRAAERSGPTVVVGVDRTGRVDPAAVLEAVDAAGNPDDGGVALVHLQWANHEVATVQPVAEVVAGCRERGVLVHVDAAAAAGHVPIDFDGLGADLLSVSGHKLGGPTGTGALLVRRGLRLDPLLVGGDQERARRAGTENVAGIVGLGAACAAIDVEREATEQRRLTDRLLAAATAVDGVHLLGDPAPAGRLPHLLCFAVEDIEPQAVLLGLDRRGIAAHSGSACASEGLEPSPVLEAMGVDAHRSLRVSVGWTSTDADVDAFAAALPEVVGELRSLRA